MTHADLVKLAMKMYSWKEVKSTEQSDYKGIKISSGKSLKLGRKKYETIGKLWHA